MGAPADPIAGDRVVCLPAADIPPQNSRRRSRAGAGRARPEIREARQPLRRADDPIERPLSAPVEARCNRIFGVLGPRHPDLADLQAISAEKVLRLGEAREMVPVLVGDDEDLDPTSGGLKNVLRYHPHFRLRLLGAKQDAEVDQHVDGLFVLAGECQEKAVPQPLPEHAYPDLAHEASPDR